METPVQVEFHGIEALPEAQEMASACVNRLEKRFGRITACRVVVTGPGRHHRFGGPYDVRVRLSLPNGRQVDVDHINHGDERYADIRFAINDAFKRARRQLQDEVELLRGNTKHHQA